jgi:schlafen family protein
MPVRAIPFEQIAAEHIEQLKARAVREDRTLEFKRELTFDDKGRFELLKDVSAMANASGGVIVYGVKEGEGDDAGVAVALPGLIGSPDDTDNRVDQFLHDGLDERVPGVLHRTIKRPGGGFYLVIRVPASHLAPHMVKGSPRFYMRGTTTNQPMDARQIKEVALRVGTALERAKDVVSSRVGALRSRVPGSAPDAATGGAAVLHVVPLFADPYAFDFTNKAVRQRLEQVKPLSASGPGVGETRYALEGYYREAPSRQALVKHVLFMRNGAIEFLKLHIWQRAPINERIFYPGGLEGDIIEAITEASHLAESGLLPMPALVSLELLGIGGSSLRSAHADELIRAPTQLPEIALEPWLLNEWGAEAELQIRHMFDVMWQAYGQARCGSYDEATGKRRQ